MSVAEEAHEPILLDLKLSVYHADKRRANYLTDPRFNFHIGIPDREVYETLREVSERWFLCGLPSEETWYVTPISERDAARVNKNSVGVIKPQPHKSAGKDYYSLIFYGLTPRDGFTYDTATHIYRCSLSPTGKTLSFPNPGKLKRVPPKRYGRDVAKPAHTRPFEPIRLYPEPVQTATPLPPLTLGNDDLVIAVLVKKPDGKIATVNVESDQLEILKIGDRRGWVFWE